VSARSYLDWLALWLQGQPGMKTDARKGELPQLRWRFVEDEELKGGDTSDTEEKAGGPALDAKTSRRLQEVLEWRYGYDAATKRAAKSSVTALRRTVNEGLEEEAETIFPVAKRRARTKLSAADTGLAHHKFLQHFDFEKAAGMEALEKEGRRLEKENYLTQEERAAVELKNIATFWGSDIGKKIREQAGSVRRELPFTARFTPRELDEILGTKSGDLEDEFVVVQGVVDLAVLLPKEIWVVDFKTDEAQPADLPKKTKFYTPQLKLYAQALEKIYSRPVTKCWLHFLAAGRTEMV